MPAGLLTTINEAEEGHAAGLPGPVIAGIGAILLGIGAANGTGVLCVIGGVVAAVGMVAASILQHTQIEYPIYRRLDNLEKK